MIQSIDYTAGLGNAAIFLECCKGGQYWNFTTLAYVGARSADTRSYLTERSGDADFSTYEVEVTPPPGDFVVRAVLASDSTILGSDPYNAPPTVTQIVTGVDASTVLAKQTTLLAVGERTLELPTLSDQLEGGLATQLLLDQVAADVALTAGVTEAAQAVTETVNGFSGVVADLTAALVIPDYVGPAQVIPGPPDVSFQSLYVRAKHLGVQWAEGDIASLRPMRDQVSNGSVLDPAPRDVIVGADGLAVFNDVDKGATVEFTLRRPGNDARPYYLKRFVVDDTDVKGVHEYQPLPSGVWKA